MRMNVVSSCRMTGFSRRTLLHGVNSWYHDKLKCVDASQMYISPLQNSNITKKKKKNFINTNQKEGSKTHETQSMHFYHSYGYTVKTFEMVC